MKNRWIWALPLAAALALGACAPTQQGGETVPSPTSEASASPSPSAEAEMAETPEPAGTPKPAETPYDY